MHADCPELVRPVRMSLCSFCVFVPFVAISYCGLAAEFSNRLFPVLRGPSWTTLFIAPTSDPNPLLTLNPRHPRQTGHGPFLSESHHDLEDSRGHRPAGQQCPGRVDEQPRLDPLFGRKVAQADSTSSSPKADSDSRRAASSGIKTGRASFLRNFGGPCLRSRSHR